MNRAVERAGYGPAELAILSGAAAEKARREICGWHDYAPTPLVSLPAVARASAVTTVLYKDEGKRFGLGSFKALGGAYGVQRVAERLPRREVADLTVACATDSNHGRAVAWGARRAGCKSVVVHPSVSSRRIDAIREYGAELRRVAGNYDDSVCEAARQAALHGWVLVSDTSYEGWVDVPRDVMHGYTLLIHEALQQCGVCEHASHVFVQAGVGGLAAAVAGYLWEHYGHTRPRLVVVEPQGADCLLRSCVAGTRTAVSGELRTIMAGLARGEPSMLASELLRKAADAFVSIRDSDAIACVRLLGTRICGETMVAGESGSAGLAGFLAVASDSAIRGRLGIDRRSVVLAIGTEADTDPELYRTLLSTE